jgi:hypothetical protein
MRLLKIKRQKTRKLVGFNLQTGGNTDSPELKTTYSVAEIERIKEN